METETTNDPAYFIDNAKCDIQGCNHSVIYKDKMCYSCWEIVNTPYWRIK